MIPDHVERTRLAERVAELESEVARLVDEREVAEVELAALRANLALQADYLATLERIPEEVVAPKDVHIRNLEAIIVELRRALEARGATTPSRLRRVFRRMARAI